MADHIAKRLREIAGPFDDEMARVCLTAARAIERLMIDLEEQREVSDRLYAAMRPIEGSDETQQGLISAALTSYRGHRAR